MSSSVFSYDIAASYSPFTSVDLFILFKDSLTSVMSKIRIEISAEE
jgi:hypothetical protein